MLELVIPKRRFFVEEQNGEGQFIDIKGGILQLEHSLLSIKKWEAYYHKPFFKKDNKTYEEMMYYIKCMTLNKNVNPDIYLFWSQEYIDKVTKYIEDPMTGTTFSSLYQDQKKDPRGETVSAELAYYWMVTLGIPFECQKWHFNQLMTLIKVVSMKNAGPKKMSKREAAQMRAAENARRRAKYKTKG